MQSNSTTDAHFECDLCGRQCSSQYTLRSHKLVHKGEKNHRCAICHRTFFKAGSLEQHRRFAHHLDTSGKRPVQLLECENCAFRTASQDNLTRHCQKHVARKTNLPRCRLCQKHFSRNDCLIQHVREVHDRERSVECEVCGERLTKSSSRLHKMRHDGAVRRFRCPL